MHGRAAAAVLRYKLHQNGSASIVASGDSMYPVITDGSTILLERRDTYSAGDVVAFCFGDEGLLVHRIIKCESERIICKGDNTYRTEIIAATDIVGCVVGLPPVDATFLGMSMQVHALAVQCRYDLEAVHTDALYRAYQKQYLTPRTK